MASQKTDIFYGQCKKDKIYLTKRLIFSTNFDFFTQPKRQIDFSWKDFVYATSM
jgi:hypothetical protein